MFLSMQSTWNDQKRPVVTQESRYANYAAYCKQIGTKPLPVEAWLKAIHSIAETNYTTAAAWAR